MTRRISFRQRTLQPPSSSSEGQQLFCYLPTEMWACHSRTTTRHNAFIFNLLASGPEGERLYKNFRVCSKPGSVVLKRIAPSTTILLPFTDCCNQCQWSPRPCKPCIKITTQPRVTGVRGMKVGQPKELFNESANSHFTGLGDSSDSDVQWSLLAHHLVSQLNFLFGSRHKHPLKLFLSLCGSEV